MLKGILSEQDWNDTSAMQFVFDTNIVVSALAFSGHADIALRRIIAERDRLLLSKPDEPLGIQHIKRRWLIF